MEIRIHVGSKSILLESKNGTTCKWERGRTQNNLPCGVTFKLFSGLILTWFYLQKKYIKNPIQNQSLYCENFNPTDLHQSLIRVRQNPFNPWFASSYLPTRQSRQIRKTKYTYTNTVFQLLTHVVEASLPRPFAENGPKTKNEIPLCQLYFSWRVFRW